MKWSRWIVFSLVTCGALAVNAAEPRLSPPRISRVAVTAARYQEPDAAPPSAAAPRAAITPHAPVHYRQATWDIWSGTSPGYVYSPGVCDYTPPCVNHLWDGYVQTFCRCHPPQMHHGRLGGCGDCGNGGGMFAGCGTCGSGSSCGCGGHASLLKRAHGWHFGGKIHGGCTSCGDMAPSCAAPTCAAPSCGYDMMDDKYPAPAPAPQDAESPPAPMPTAEGEFPDYELPLEKAARGKRYRGFTFPESSLQR